MFLRSKILLNCTNN